jgi:P-type E1-E2 ATPase
MDGAAGLVWRAELIHQPLSLVPEGTQEGAMNIDTHLITPQAKVRRNRSVETLPVSELKRGDVVLLESGDRVPADCRLVECENLRIQEADLTGDSEPADKLSATSSAAELSGCERSMMAFMGTRVVAGRGFAEVIATGEQTEWARLTTFTRTIPRPRRPDQYGEVRQVMIVVLLTLICILLVLGLLSMVTVAFSAGVAIG